VRDALKKMKSGTTVGPDLIPIEIYKCLGEVRLEWVTELLNVIFRTAMMPSE